MTDERSRILTTHAGSLPRSAGLSAVDTGVDDVDSAVRHAVRGQADAGIDLLNDGMCWGNGKTPRTTDIDLAEIVGVLLRAKSAGLMLMAATGRHVHTVAPPARPVPRPTD